MVQQFRYHKDETIDTCLECPLADCIGAQRVECPLHPRHHKRDMRRYPVPLLENAVRKAEAACRGEGTG